MIATKIGRSLQNSRLTMRETSRKLRKETPLSTPLRVYREKSTVREQVDLDLEQVDHGLEQVDLDSTRCNLKSARYNLAVEVAFQTYYRKGEEALLKQLHGPQLCCLLCCLPACLLASAERRNQREMRSLLEELRGAFRGSDVRFVSMLRRYEGQNDVFHYEDRWLGFAKDAAAARRLADLPTNWLPYQKSKIFFPFNKLDRDERAY